MILHLTWTQPATNNYLQFPFMVYHFQFLCNVKVRGNKYIIIKRDKKKGYKMERGAKSLIFFLFIWERMWRCALSRPCDINNRQMIQIYNDSKWFRYIIGTSSIWKETSQLAVEWKILFQPFLQWRIFSISVMEKILYTPFPTITKRQKTKTKSTFKKTLKGGWSHIKPQVRKIKHFFKWTTSLINIHT